MSVLDRVPESVESPEDLKRATVTDLGNGEGPNIPKTIRDRYGVGLGDTVWWVDNEDGTLTLVLPE